MQDCRAAYESLDPWKVFDACGQLIADGDLPEDANVWDWLMLAERQVNSEYENWDNIKAYRGRSEESGQRTGSVVFDKFTRADDEQTRKKLLAEALSFGPWFDAYVYSRRAMKLSSNNWTKEAIAEYDKAIKLNPSYADLFERGKLHDNLRKPKKALDDFRRSSDMAASLGLSHTRSYTELGYVDKAGLSAIKERLAKGPLPHDPAVMRKEVLTLAEGGKLAHALRVSAGLLAYQPTIENWELRGDIQAAAGNDLLAAQNYLIAMQMNDAAFKKLTPKWSAARETFLAKQGDAKPENLMDVMSALPTYVREKGNLEPKFISSGLRTQWQADGSLRIWTQGDDGFYLQPDGVKFQKALEGGGRGPIEAPQETSSGKRIYPVGEFSLAWIPNDSFYFGLFKPIAQSANGRHVFVNGMEYGGPYIAGQSVHTIREISRRKEGEKTIITFTGGLVETTEPGRQARLDFPGMGWFQGDVTEKHMPHTGLITHDDGKWSLLYNGAIVKTGQARSNIDELAEIDIWSSIKLAPNGDVIYHKQYGYDHTWINYPASGAERFASTSNSAPDWRAFEEARKAQAEKEALDESYREAIRATNSYVPDSSRRACYRCNGSGQVWQSGGASQSRVSAPSGSSASQREDFYNSASSIRTSYSSGGMGTCPVCGGSGNQ